VTVELLGDDDKPKNRYSSTMLFLGLGAIIFVPFFKVITHLPPYVGMMLSLGVVAIFAEVYSNSKFSISQVDSWRSMKKHQVIVLCIILYLRIEMPSILFFLRILMAVAALESLGVLFGFAEYATDKICL
jgi:hypothetical protein